MGCGPSRGMDSGVSINTDMGSNLDLDKDLGKMMVSPEPGGRTTKQSSKPGKRATMSSLK